MTLKDLENLVERAKSLGFQSEDIEVKFQYTITELEVQTAITRVSADSKNVKPVLQIDLK
jgi:hypothetical protein